MNSTVNRVICIVVAQLVFRLWRRVFRRRKRQKVCSQFRPEHRVISCDKPISAKRDAKRSSRTQRFGFSGVNANPTR